MKTIHDKARQMVAQARGPLEMSEAYRRLARCGAERRRVAKAERDRNHAVRYWWTEVET